MSRVPGLSSFALPLLVLCSLGSVSCSSPQPPKTTSEGTAYVGPLTLSLRKDLATKSQTVGEAKHGDQVDILETRRRLVRVRTSAGIEGWTDASLLLTTQQMDELRRLSESAAKLPSIGTAKAYDIVNMHPGPSRQSPSFYQIPEGEAVEVVGHRATPRIQQVTPAPASRRPPPPSKKSKAKEAREAALQLPPPPRPVLPGDWQRLSRPNVKDLPGYAPPAPPPPVALDDWNLVRTHDGKAGWVLARMLYMAIPDEVAQYAEGHRITSYLPLGEVSEDGQTKRNWLWTTIGKGTEQGEFDSFRVFVWSKGHHRYETAYIERNVTGYFPVAIEPNPVQPDPKDRRHPNAGEPEQAFSLVIEDKDGKLYKRTYAFSGYRVHLVSKVAFEPRPEASNTRASVEPDSSRAEPPAGWWAKMRALPRRWLHR